MKTNILAAAIALSDHDLLTGLITLARTEREAGAELLGHLTALDLRPSLYAAQGYGSLFDYCTSALGLSEDAACSRISVVRACKRFPVILDHLASGNLTLTSVRLLAPHLTAENHEAVLARARNKRQGEIQALIAELAPRPDVPASVRRLPVSRATAALPVLKAATAFPERTEGANHQEAALSNSPAEVANISSPVTAPTGPDASPVSSPTVTMDEDGAAEDGFRLQSPPPHSHRPIVQALAPQRYRVQFTIGQAAHDDLRTVQALLRREIPSGDPGAIFERALALLRREVERAKLGVGTTPRRTGGARPQGPIYDNRIRFKTDTGAMRDSLPGRERHAEAREVSRKIKTTCAPGDMPREVKTTGARHERPASRHIPNEVRRAVWYRDRGQCAFVSTTGRRCAERNFLELHHIHPYALKGPATVGNISLRCRRHNQYEAECVFGPREPMTAAGPTQGGTRRPTAT